MTKKETNKLLVWLLSDDTGVSSKNMVRRFLDLPTESFGYPHDADDFGRCYRLLITCPFISVSIMKDVDKIWADLVGVWQKLTRLYEKSKGEEIYYLIDSIDEKYRKDSVLSYSDIKLGS